MRNKQSVTLYNVLFPVWLLVWIPSFLWLLLIPLNFAIDYLVLYKSLPASTERKAFCNKHTWKICAAGFAADFAGSLFLFALFVVTDACGVSFAQAVNQGLAFNPFANGLAFVLVVIAILLSAYLIYRFDRLIIGRPEFPVPAAPHALL